MRHMVPLEILNAKRHDPSARKIAAEHARAIEESLNALGTMRTSIERFCLLILGICLATALAQAPDEAPVPGRCATKHLTGEAREKTRRLVEDWTSRRRHLQGGEYEITTYFHVMQFDNSFGAVLDSRIESWMRSLNRAFEGTSLSFQYAGRTTNVNRDWFLCSPDNEANFKPILHVGDLSVLNIWMCQPPSGTYGWATPPTEGADLDYDGVVMFSSNVPPDSQDFFNQADTLVHLAGEWLGLRHTYEVR